MLQKQARRDFARDRGVHRDICPCAGRPAAAARRRTAADAAPVAGAQGAGGGAGGGRRRRARRRRQQAPPRRRRRRTREFPAGSYIVRMDQPYSRIADALLDYQYWAPNDPQTAARTTTPAGRSPKASACRPSASPTSKVLDAPMELVKGDVKAPSGVTGTGTLFAINHNADNALITLRYKLKDADIQMAEEPFDAARHEVRPRHVRHQGRRAGGSRQGDDELGLKAVRARRRRRRSRCIRRARRASRSCTRGATRRPKAGGGRRSTSTASRTTTSIRRTIGETANLRAKYDVIVVGPGRQPGRGRGHADVAQRRSRTRTRPTRRTSARGRRPTTRASGMQLEGLHAPARVRRRRAACSSRRTAARTSPSPTASRYGVSVEPRRHRLARRRLAAAHEARRRRRARSCTACPTTSPSTATRGESFSVSATAAAAAAAAAAVAAAARRGGGRGGGAGGRPTGRGTPDDPDVVQGRPADEGDELPPCRRRRRCSRGSTRCRRRKR